MPPTPSRKQTKTTQPRWVRSASAPFVRTIGQKFISAIPDPVSRKRFGIKYLIFSLPPKNRARVPDRDWPYPIPSLWKNIKVQLPWNHGKEKVPHLLSACP